MAPKSKKRRFLFKAAWRGTALRFWIDAVDEKDAAERAAKYVMRMEGGVRCLDLELLKEDIDAVR